MKFRADDNTKLQSLFSVANGNSTSEHFHLYINGGAIGYELRKASGYVSSNLSVSIANEGINTVAFRVEDGVGYSIFLNGEKVFDLASENATFLATLDNLNTVNLGKTERSSGNEYLYTGDIDNVELFNKPLSDSYLTEVTGQTLKAEAPLPEGAFKTDPVAVFEPGQLNSNFFRIPSLITTTEGTLIAGIDVREGGGKDSPNDINTGVKRSTDNGAT